MRKYLSILLLCLLLAACGKPDVTIPEGYYSGDPSVEESSQQADPQFFMEKQEQEMADEYFLCRRDPDGTVTRLYSMGLQEVPFLVEGERIYFTSGDTLVSTDLQGQDIQTFFDTSDARYSFNRVLEVKDGWIACAGTKWAEITDDPAALPGPHRVRVITRVKTDFSQFYEAESKE